MCVRSIENGKAEMILGSTPDFVEGIRKFRGEWVPIVRLRTLFGLDGSEEPVLSQLIYMRTENGTMAFRVDKVAEIDQLLDGEFQTIPIIVNSGRSAYVSGACSHHGRIIIIVNHNKFVFCKFHTVFNLFSKSVTIPGSSMREIPKHFFPASLMDAPI